MARGRRSVSPPVRPPWPRCAGSQRPERSRRTPRDGKRLCVEDLQVGRDATLATVLERDLGLDEAVRVVAVQRIDQRSVALADEAAPDLAGAGQLTVVGIELLVQHEEP